MNTATSQFDGHTPGPWQIDTDTRDGARTLILDRDGLLVADSGAGSNPNDRAAARAECERNARLIAAAPELLRQRDALAEALREVTDRYERLDRRHALPDSGPNGSIARARAALASIENGA